MKKASGVVANIYCVKCKKKTPKFTLVGYDDTLPRGGIRIIGTCAVGHENMSSFMGKKDFETAISTGKVIKGGGKCPYGGGDDDKVESMSNAPADISQSLGVEGEGHVTMFEGAARHRRSRSKSHSKKKGSAHRRKSKSKSHSRKSKSKSHSRKSHSHGKK
jgi:hypothetical protein